MKKHKFFALLLAGTLFTGCLAGQAVAAPLTSDIILETAPETVLDNNELIKSNLPEDSTTQASQKNDRITIKTDDVEVGVKFFQKKVIYTTFNKDDLPGQYLPEELSANGDIYVFSSADTPLLVSQEEIIPKTMSYESELFTGDESEHLPEEYIQFPDGNYKLISKELKEQQAEERTEYKEVSVTYSDVEAGVQIPDVKSTEFEDLDTKQKVNADLELVKKEVVKEAWRDDFNFPITITGYDADVFVLNGKEVPKDADLTDYADDFLQYLKLDSEKYKISSIEWTGDAYEKDGMLLRNATAHGSKCVQDIRATYGGNVTLPSIVGKNWSCVYEQDIPENERVLYSMSTTAVYMMKENIVTEEKTIPQKIMDKVIGLITAAYEAVAAAFKEHPVISSIPLVAIAAMLAFFISKRNKKPCLYDQEVVCPYKKHDAEICKGCNHYRNRQSIN